LVFDAAGNLYGATLFGGGFGTCDQNIYLYCGTVFELSPSKQQTTAWTEKVLYSFKSGTDGANPNGGLVLDGNSAVYGTTYFGGNATGECKGGTAGTGCGTVFKLRAPDGKGKRTEKVLHRFNGEDGANPAVGVVSDTVDHLYGTTYAGGNNGWGTVFGLSGTSGKSRTWTETTLYRFDDGADGASPLAGLIFDGRGNLYGAAYSGSGTSRYGNVFRLRPSVRKGQGWTFSVLRGLGEGSPDSAQPAATPVFDKVGSLYSTTKYGGTGQGCGFGGCGTVFVVSP
jgi:hypothetical protein